MKKVTMADVAKLANVSKSTVSQYLNKRYEYMSEETRKRIAQAIEELGYQPNVIARSLKQKTTATIGVIVFNMLHMLTTQVLHAIEEECQKREFQVIVCNSGDDPEKERKYIDMLLAKQVDGLIVFPTGKNEDVYHRLVAERFPIVFVDRMVPGVEADSVLLDNFGAAEMAVDYLAAHGYDRIAIVTPPLVAHNVPRMERLQGFRMAMEKRGLKVDDRSVIAAEAAELPGELQKRFAAPERPNALFAINDLTLMGILRFVKETGIRVPDELGLISIDDVPFADIYTPMLTTIAQPTFAMGKKAAERVFEQMDQERTRKPRVFRFSPTLVERTSIR
ncbi:MULTISPECIES: LacI family DNA-binding transcriptional regulator [Geobacillus]|uniref:Transcriptional regulator n=4 Tax=Geobacillus thermodenitrificans TaxID=33940 RepID=A4IPE3_GEOTN|nr:MULTISPECIES: LacI family DNA-binding transcriptional regulator [Geobacillus]ABO67197.1 Transcriptional regulator [Geobacillus thermodenitrificans NG80-2]ARA99575.1 LacI family transcriptional regulator [Geobacillus thermodenitrificans]ATO35769.1 LacI family transcriptional regulator [Geobacillus thermodenitrificans]KQB93132.1 putative HTH-type transcriptional regulator EndR [Geobacillus sp. PA-3]MED3717241.1 LacI family DNA-binding transcriptional regulator [Geobacillus thermodenitrificans